MLVTIHTQIFLRNPKIRGVVTYYDVQVWGENNLRIGLGVVLLKDWASGFSYGSRV